jgi:hypothetical protein
MTQLSDQPADGGAHRVAVVGLGKLGQLLVERIERRRDTRLVGVVDADPAKVGRRLGDVLGRETGLDLQVSGSLESIRGVDVALVATTSRLQEVAPVLEQIAALGVDAITICEEAVYPRRQFPERSAQLDAVARSHGVSILGCGSNPGFLMDVLPIACTLGLERVERVTIRRSLDMRPHRPERLARFGLGYTPEQFAAIDATTLVGHVGFTQSMHCLADALGWDLDETHEAEVRPAVVATEDRRGEFVTVKPGTVAVIEHRAWARRGDDRLIDIAMYFGFHDVGDDIGHGDRYEITATDQTISMHVEPSWGPFATTPSAVVNLIPAVRAGAPGLLSVADFPVRSLAARGRDVIATDPLRGENHLASLVGRT